MPRNSRNITHKKCLAICKDIALSLFCFVMWGGRCSGFNYISYLWCSYVFTRHFPLKLNKNIKQRIDQLFSSHHWSMIWHSSINTALTWLLNSLDFERVASFVNRDSGWQKITLNAPSITSVMLHLQMLHILQITAPFIVIRQDGIDLNG